MNIEKYLESQLEILVASLVAIPFAHRQNKYSLEEIQEFIFKKKQTNGKTLIKSFQNEVSKSLEKVLLSSLNSWLDSDLKESVTIHSPVHSPVQSPISSPKKAKEQQVKEQAKDLSDVLKSPSKSVSSTTVVEKVPTPVKKTTTKKPPTPKSDAAPLVQTTLVQTNLVQAHPLMTGETLEKTTRKSKAPVPENYTGPTCKYVFKRGELKGKECGKPATADNEYCEQCNNKKTNKPLESKEEKPKEKKTKASDATKPMVGFTTSVGKRATEKPKIELRETGQPNTYVDIQTNIVVKKVVDNERTLFVAVGIQEESGFRTLNDDEKKEALNRNFTLAGSDRLSPARVKPIDEQKKIVAKQPVSNIPDIEDSDNE